MSENISANAKGYWKSRALTAEARIKELEGDLAAERSRQDGMYPLAEANWLQNVLGRDARINELEKERSEQWRLRLDRESERDVAKAAAAELRDQLSAAEAEVSRLQAALRLKDEALEPFERYARALALRPSLTDDETIYVASTGRETPEGGTIFARLSYGDFRQAAQARGGQNG